MFVGDKDCCDCLENIEKEDVRLHIVGEYECLFVTINRIMMKNWKFGAEKTRRVTTCNISLS